MVLHEYIFFFFPNPSLYFYNNIFLSKPKIISKTKNSLLYRLFFVNLNSNYLALATNSLRSLPALNFTTFLAGMLIAFLVWGLTPLRAARLETSKEPKPIN